MEDQDANTNLSWLTLINLSQIFMQELLIQPLKLKKMSFICVEMAQKDN